MNALRRPVAANAGFTLLELLVLIAIVSVATLIVAPLLSRPPSQAQLRADATRLAAALRVTRAAAMAQNREMVLVIDGDRRTYLSPVIGTSQIAAQIGIDMELAESERQSGIVGGIRFFPTGRSTGGDIRLHLSNGDARVRVSWATGHVTLAP
jgi:general secretion pathway protein H